MSVYFFALLFSFGLMGLGALLWVWFEDRRPRAPRIAPQIENLTRDPKLPFHGKVKRQIRIVKPEDVS